MRERMGSGGPRGLQILRSGVSVRGGFDSHAFPPLVVLRAIVTASCLAACVAPCVSAGLAVPSAPAPAAAPDTARAAPVPPDSARSDTLSSEGETGAAADTSGIVTIPARAPRTLPKLGRFDQPRWVMLRSLLLPGWGQVHNRSWIKATLLMLGDGALRVRFVRDERHLGDVGRQADRRQTELTTAIGDTLSAWAALEAARQGGNPDEIAAAEAARLASLDRLRSANDAYNSIVPVYNALLDRTINRRWLLGGVVLYALIDAYVDAHFKNFDVNIRFDPALPEGSGIPGGRIELRWAF